MYNSLTIFYFTGTGNALAAANWIARVAAAQNIKTEIIKITPSLKVNESNFSEKSLIGFCYPTHGFNAPPVVIDFCLGFPRLKNNVFLLNTRAGMKIYKLFMPGLSGLAQLLPALILRIKGLKVVGYQPMDLPSNWISIHPGLREEVIHSIFRRCQRKTERFAKTTLKGEKTYKGWLSLPIDLLISPISIAYYFFGRFALAKTFVAGINCNNCGLCEKECPVKAIKMKNKVPFWTKKCESCMHCMNICPQRAIQTPHLFTVILWWLAFSVIPIFLLKFFLVIIRKMSREMTAFESFISNHFDLFIWILMFVTGIPVIFFSYRILHFLMRFRFFNWLITYTSLTRFKFWRRYFAPKKYLKTN
ncbi:EFR1 family ferrodoxin [Draconibacterium sp.]|nr:EFR1 family ferrodoxin [Draconibacterium sp.]